LFKCLAGTGIGAVTFTITGFPRVIRHLPRAVGAACRRIYRENRIGRNLKGVAFVMLPVATVLVIPFTLVGSFCYGFVAGAVRSVKEGMFKSAASLAKDAADLDQRLVEDLLPAIGEYEPMPLPDGKEPFDISLLALLYTIPNGLATAFVGAGIMTTVFVLRLPIIWVRLTRAIFHDTTGGMFLFAVFMWILLDVGSCIAPALLLAGAALFSLGAGCQRTYAKGIPAAWSRVFTDAKWLNKTLADFRD
jgi:hypothetical protein